MRLSCVVVHAISYNKKRCKISLIHSGLYKDLIEENFPGIFSADTGQPQALDGIESKKNQL